MRDFKDLIVWERSHRLTLALYRVTDTFPKHEVFGLSSQIVGLEFRSPPILLRVAVAGVMATWAVSFRLLWAPLAKSPT